MNDEVRRMQEGGVQQEVRRMQEGGVQQEVRRMQEGGVQHVRAPTSDPRRSPDPMRTAPDQTIPIAMLDPSIRRLVEECRDSGCRRCWRQGGFREIHGQRAIICGCAAPLFRRAMEFLATEKERREAGLPARTMRIADRELEVGDSNADRGGASVDIGGDFE